VAKAVTHRSQENPGPGREELDGLAFRSYAGGKARSGKYGIAQMYMLINTRSGADDIGGDQSSKWCVWIGPALLRSHLRCTVGDLAMDKQADRVDVLSSAAI